MAQILVVEDESLVAMDIREQLSSLGHEVVGMCPSAEEAIDSIAVRRPQVVLMDINLQGKMDGIQAASVMQERFQLPVVFLTAHAEERTLQRATAVHPYGYIIKPFDKDELRVTVALALSRHEVPREVEEEEVVPIEVTGDPQTVEVRERFLTAHPLFKQLTPENIKALAGAGSVRILSAGSLLVRSGDPINYGFVVLSGRLAVVKATSEGKELTVELLSPGDATGVLMASEL